MSDKRLIIMVSSSVRGFEVPLDLIFTLLTTYGYEVWMSYKGTIPVFSNLSAVENCLAAVEKCDLFLGLITPNYGSNVTDDELSITHREMKKAIELNRPRWLLVHDHVVFARSLLIDLSYRSPESRIRLNLKLQKENNQSLTDLRVINMYEDAILHQIDPQDRRGDWVQEFSSDEDVKLFVSSQFFRYLDIETFIQENFSDHSNVSKIIQAKRGDRS